MRLTKLRKKLETQGKFPYLISNLTNIYYLTGFEGSFGTLVLDNDKSFFITDSRYTEYASAILPKSIEVLLQKTDLTSSLKLIFKIIGKKKLYIEQSVAHATFLSLKKQLNKIKLLTGDNEIEALRMVKEENEIENLRKAVSLTDMCFSHLLKVIKPGMTEWDISVEIEYFYRKKGCRKSSFDSIVASGKGSSMPHYITSMTKKIENNDILLIDMGCLLNGYNSDLTRTIFIGNCLPEFRDIYNIVRNAQEEAISKVRQGITAATLDKTARDIIDKNGFGHAFGHSLGHGVGLEIHENPYIKNNNSFRLKKNIPFTIEPGIYIPDKGGVRIEDVVIVNATDCENLTKSSKDIIIL
jgi:Xaa-Pro aminopeptidase